jgi:hypothetical protein
MMTLSAFEGRAAATLAMAALEHAIADAEAARKSRRFMTVSLPRKLNLDG